jgi:hypothetical protein
VKRTLGRVATILGGAGALIGIVAGPALADCHATNYQASSEKIHTVPVGSWGYAGWNANNPVGPVLTIQSQGINLAAGWCNVVAFDWATAVYGGHYDARMVRDCDGDSDLMSDSLQEKASQIIGLQKWGTCYAPAQQYRAEWCKVSGMSTPGCGTLANMNFVLTSNNKTTRWWSRSSNGVLSFSSGGVGTDPNK